MFVYLGQHGEAEREEVDPARPLTEKGRNDVRKVALFTAGAHVRVERIFHSGKLRARQTAEILGGVLKPSSIGTLHRRYRSRRHDFWMSAIIRYLFHMPRLVQFHPFRR